MRTPLVGGGVIGDVTESDCALRRPLTGSGIAGRGPARAAGGVSRRQARPLLFPTPEPGGGRKKVAAKLFSPCAETPLEGQGLAALWESISCKSKGIRESISVVEVKASIDPVPTNIDESSSVVLRYRTPHFRASAQVLMPPIVKKETWIVGWIQACNHMEFYNYYGEHGM
uniref:Uncharacterized protein n=1 Tax=Sphaerodactylus townsendi TaxID=933632 RepID=A0ACB8F067_9SAUR